MNAIPLKRSYGAGREDQFEEMMQELSRLEGKYKGVRGELLAKVRAELAKLKPSPASLSLMVEAAPTVAQAPCRVCGRDMKLNADGRASCQNGHTR